MKRLLLILFLLASLCLSFGLGMQGSRYADEAKDYYQRGDYDYALKYFLLADKAASGERADYHYWLGKTYIALEDTMNAKSWLNSPALKSDSDLSVFSNSLIEIIDEQKYIFTKSMILNLPKYINSRSSDFAPIVSQDGVNLYFTSLRTSAKDKENIWYCPKLNNAWGKPVFNESFNTDKNESIGSFSSDGRTVYLTGNYQKDTIDGDIYESTYYDSWSKPQQISILHSDQYDGQPMVFEDSLMFFVSSREGGIGSTDIYVSVKKGNDWSEPVNLGPTVNTGKNEQTPFLDWDRKTLFFASDGHNGFGGYDLFKVVKIGKSWTDWSLPENLGISINSVKNDRSFFHIKHTTDAYFSSDRGGEGFENLYGINLTYAPRSFVIMDKATGKKTRIIDGIDNASLKKPIADLQISGKVMDDDGKPLKVMLEFFYYDGDKKLSSAAYSGLEGLFSLTLPHTDEFEININADGYFHYTKTFSVGEDNVIVLKPIVLEALKLEKVFVFNNIQFIYNSKMLLKEDLPILNQIVLTMLNNPEVKIEISGHTCSIGTPEQNKKLSLLRAREVRMYLFNHGISMNRVNVMGYGESKPIKSNETAHGRRMNRRVEVKILEN